MFRGQFGLTLAEGGRIQDPWEFLSPGVKVWLARKEELTVSDCVWTLCFRRALEEACGRSRARIERQRSTVLTTAPILSSCKSPSGPKPVDLLPRLLLDITEKLVAAAASRPPCPGDAVCGGGSKSCRSGSPGHPALLWSLLHGLCLLQPVSHLFRPSETPFQCQAACPLPKHLSRASHPRCLAQPRNIILRNLICVVSLLPSLPRIARDKVWTLRKLPSQVSSSLPRNTKTVLKQFVDQLSPSLLSLDMAELFSLKFSSQVEADPPLWKQSLVIESARTTVSSGRMISLSCNSPLFFPFLPTVTPH